MGGLNIKIVDGIRMFKPRTLKKQLVLRDDQVREQQNFTRPFIYSKSGTLPTSKFRHLMLLQQFSN